MKIEPLPIDVRSYLRSGVAITSVTQCIEELVLNSLDAGATCVAVRVDLNCFKLQVVDNGSGVPHDQLNALGNRFCTSKCHALADLDNLCHFGYRGEALASIRDSCGILEITTRSKLSSKTYCKIFQNGKSLKVSESAIVRPSVGTTMTVHELFTNFPVRQKSLNKNFEMERIKEMLEGIALIRSGISFTLRNDSTGQVILSTRKCNCINATFGQLYGTVKADMLAEIRGSKEVYRIEGYIGREGHSRKNLQFVYVNGRLVKKSKIHKLLNKILLSLPALKSKPRVSTDTPVIPFSKQNVFVSPPKFSEVYPVYILEVKCPVSEYDITFEPAKTMVEFKDWDSLLSCIEEVTKSFLSKENVAVNTTEMECESDEPAKEAEVVQDMPIISTDSMKDVLVSKAAKRVPSQKNTALLFETPDSNSSSLGTVSITKEQTEEYAFTTPADKNINFSKAAIGLGKRNLGVKLTTEDSGASEVENELKLDNYTDLSNSTSDDSTCPSHVTVVKEQDNTKAVRKEGCEGNSVNKVNKESQVTKPSSVQNGLGTMQTNGSVPQCSLSRYRQSIGKFTGGQNIKINIDESLKKLNKIKPSISKPNNKTLFSSLQRFRRKHGTEAVSGEIKLLPDVQAHEDSGMNNNAHANTIKAVNRYSDNAIKISPFRNTVEENRSNAQKKEDNFQAGSCMTVEACTESLDRNTHKSKCIAEENKCCPTSSGLIEENNSLQEEKDKFKFTPCYIVNENVDDLNNEQMSDTDYADSVNENLIAENGPFSEMINYSFKRTGKDHGFQKDQDKGYSNIYNFCTTEIKNLAGPYSPNMQLPWQQMYANDNVSDNECDVQSSRCGRKRRAYDSEFSSEYEKHIKYTARPLNIAELESELKYKPEICDIGSVCNNMNCDESQIDSDLVQGDENNCDQMADISHCGVGEIFNYNKETSCEKQCDTENVNSDTNFSVENNSKTCNIAVHDMENEVEVIDKFIDSTQPFNPIEGEEFLESDKSPGKNSEAASSMTPESLGFTPKIQTESPARTPTSGGFIPYRDSECTIYASGSDSRDENKDKVISLNIQMIEKEKVIYETVSQQLTEQSRKLCQDLVHEIKQANSDTHDHKILQDTCERTELDDKINESVTLTQLLKTPLHEKDHGRQDFHPEIENEDADIEDVGVQRKGFSFADLFSQTPSCSEKTETAAKDVSVDTSDGNTATGDSSNCSDCNKGMREELESTVRNCTEKGDNPDTVVDINEGKIESCGKADDIYDEIIWTDSPWDISDSSFNLKNEINQDRNEVPEDDDVNNDGRGAQEEMERERSFSAIEDKDETVKSMIETQNCEIQDVKMLDSLDDWYQNLDAGITVSSDVLQSKKPSDVVRRLHACRFSKQSLKSVKVLGQLDKKFIACLINTDEQSKDTDHNMLVLIDQHAAHERIRLEILTEEAFQSGDKGRGLAPFTVDPAYKMNFAEHEVRTILSFRDGYLKLGVALGEDTPSTVLISSVPACLVDKEKNNKIYWSTVQVLIREHIAVFMSTQISHGVLPQTVHKVLCSLACHGAIKFGDKLSADECMRLIKDLSRCDLPFQCAHGRPSVMPLMHVDKLQSLSNSKNQAKPSLWKLRQALRQKPPS